MDQAMLNRAIALSCNLPNQWAEARIDHCLSYINGEVNGQLGEFGDLLRSLEGLNEDTKVGLIMGWLKWGSNDYYKDESR